MTPSELNAILCGMAEQVAAYLLPSGRRDGRSWCAGSVHGEPGQSLRVCLEGGRAGVWSDFSSDSKGGDLLELWQQCRGLSFVDALKEAKDFAGIVDAPEMYTPRRKAKKPVEKPQCTKPKDKIEAWFDGRGITSKALEAYKVGQKDGVVVFPYLSPDGTLELVKYRGVLSESGGKKKTWSNEDPEYHLWGWQAIDNNTRSVVICEGEIDALTWFQQGIPALSVPQGAGGGDKQEAWIANDYDRLERFETIYVSMDMDKPGQESIQPIISRLGVERCKIVDLGEFKDANEAHQNGMVLKQYLDRAKTKDPEELTRLADHHDEIMREFDDYMIAGEKLPWSRTFDTIRLRPSEITVWAGVNSHGKSVALSHATVDFVAQGAKVCIASMEMKPRKLGRKMYQQIVGRDRLEGREADSVSEFLGDRVWLFEAYGTAKADRILEVFAYARKRYGVTHFIVDSLAKCGFGEDDYNGQKGFVDRLMEFAGEYDVHVHLVVHMRKRENEEKIPGKMDIKGTGAITDMVDNVIIWWRNKPKEDRVSSGHAGDESDPDAVLNCVKQRETGIEPMVGVYWHGPSCQFLDYYDSPPKQYLGL